MKILTANGQIYMCEKCHKNPAQYYVKGLTTLSFYDGLCGACCAQWLREKGDIEGAKKFEKSA